MSTRIRAVLSSLFGLILCALSAVSVGAAPSAVTTLVVTTDCQLKLSWVAPDNGAGVACSGYLIKYSTITDIVSDADFSSAAAYPQSLIPGVPGVKESIIITGLIPRTTYWFSIKARDGVAWSAPSSTGTNAGLSGSFVDTNAALISVYNSKWSWGDYDNDGDLDLAFGGYCYGQITLIYRNDNGTFVDKQANLLNVDWLAFSWGDYDNDGDLDLAYGGTRTPNYTLIYRNDEGTFVDIAAGLPGVDYTAISWGDYDNDGDLDLAFAGKPIDHHTNDRITRLFRNDAGNFADAKVGLPGVEMGSLEWGDYDNDGDIDLALCGSGNARVYRNDGVTFVDKNAGLAGVANSALAWGDYDNDGDLDLAVSGNTGTRSSWLYRNDAGSFIDSAAGLPGIDGSSMTWGDYDNDGDLDLAMCGYSISSALTRIYRNNNSSFAAIPAGLPDANIGSVVWGDYDNDGDLDLALTGNGSQWYSKIYRSLESESGNGNNGARAPSPPTTGFSAAYSTTTCTLGLLWDTATDNGAGATPAGGLYYEIRMATEPVNDSVKSWILSPSVGQGVGSGPTQRLGSYPHGYCVAVTTQPGLTLVNPPNGATYYWQVRAIDAGLAKSAWSVEQSTYVPAESIPPGQVTDLTAVTGWQVLLSWTAPGDNEYVDAVTRGMWRIDYSSMTETPGTSGGHSLYRVAQYYPGSRYSLTMTGLTPNVTYYFQIKSRDEIGNWSSLWSSTVSAVEQKVFLESNAGLTGVSNSATCWGDYDNDGDLDLALAGTYDGTNAISRVYRNDAGSFVNATGANMQGVVDCSLSWGDCDNDGDLDLALSGNYGGGYLSRVYRNDGGSFINATGASITGVNDGSLSWGDYDNDGDLDLALSGYTGSSTVTRVYRNDAGRYVNATGTSITGVCDEGSLSWGDYDNDGDLDLALSGYQTPGANDFTSLYRNDAGSFISVPGGSITSVHSCSLSWGDYDNDGDLDLALAGVNWNIGPNFFSRVYRNNAGSFVNATGASITGVRWCSLGWGDYDNDGDLDLALAGFTGAVNVSRVYRSDPGGFVQDTAAVFPSVEYCSLSWGDYDDDGDLDLALTGTTGSGSISNVYSSLRSEYGNSNAGARVPSAPVTGFATAYSTTTHVIALRWDKAVDNGAGATPDNGLYYELRMATEPISDSLGRWVITPGNGFGVGSSANQRLGSYPHGYCVASSTQPGFSLTSPLSGTTYYWQVRAMDAGLRKSAWSVEQSTFVPPDIWEPGQVSGLTATSGEQVLLTWTAPGDDGYVGTVTNGMWRIDYSSATATPGETGGGSVHSLYTDISFVVPGSPCTLALTGLLARVTYYFQIKARDEAGNWSMTWSTAASAIAGSFVNRDVALIGLEYSSLSWGDYDNDGDLDLALSGYDGHTTVARLYRNDADSFVDRNAGLAGLEDASLSWGDYDNDGDLDLALCGYGHDPASYLDCQTVIYRNDAGSFADIHAGVQGVDCGALSWGDYDNDGDLDLALCGYDSTWSPFSRIYANDAGVFTGAVGPIPGVYCGSLGWGDYDNDGDLDLALSGGTNAESISRIYRNDAGMFTDIVAGVAGASYCSLGWGDYDNDGDLDLALSGYDVTWKGCSRIYRNDALSFVNTAANVIDVYTSALSWGDFDNDGDLDLALCGEESGTYTHHTRLYRNDPGMFVDSGSALAGIANGSLSWGDCDNDGDLDLALSGGTGLTYLSTLYMCLEAESGNSNSASRAPSAPTTGLSTVYSKTSCTLSLRWDAATDNGAGATTAPGLYYDIRMATEPVSDSVVEWVVSPSIGGGVGSGSTQRLGSYPHGFSAAAVQPGLTIANPPAGATYYWQVRAMDAGLAKSAWSVEQSTYVPPDTILPGQVTGLSADSGLQMVLNWTAPGDDGYTAAVQRGMWRIDYSSSTETPGDTGGSSVRSLYLPLVSYSPGMQYTATLTGLAPVTTYYFQMKARDRAGNWSALWSSSASAVAGWFVDGMAGLSVVNYSALCWGDYDNDGDLDLAITGDTASGALARVYRNDAGALVNATGATLTGVRYGSLRWGDYDNDGDLDLALTGTDYWIGVSRVYRNDAGSFSNATGDSITGVYRSSLDWGDYDNDGDLDLALAGTTDGTSGISRVYRNDAGSFITATDASMTGVYRGALGWGDYDNDGDLDLALVGMNASEKLSRVYRNDAGSFINATGTSIPGVGTYCSLSWGDYDNDGDLDLALAGNADTPLTRVYRNDANSFVNASGDSVTGVYYCSLSWGDYDNDGDLDLAVAGTYDGSSPLSRVYRNDAGGFVNAPGVRIADVLYCSLGWGDYDNDGDLDLALSGQTNTAEKISCVYQSLSADYGTANAPPAPPSGMTATYAYDVAKSTIAFTWDPAQNDAGQSPHALYYQIVVTTTPTTWDGTKFTSPAKFIFPWQNGSPLMGAYVRPAAKVWPGASATKHAVLFTGDSTVLQPETTYYWRAQTIDAGLRRSAWSGEYPLCASVGDTVPPAGISDLTALAAGMNAVTLSWTSPGDDDAAGSLDCAVFRIKYSTVGVITSAAFDAPPPELRATTVDIATTTTAASCQTIRLANLTADGTYWFAIKTMDSTGNWSVWRSSTDMPAVNTLAWCRYTMAPGTITRLVATEGAQVQLTWTAPGNDEYTGDVTGGAWRIDYSSTTMTPGPDASYTIEIPCNFIQGATTYACTVTGLQPRATYYFQMIARDDNGNWATVWSSTSSASMCTAGSFGDINASLPPVYNSQWSWGDYDNDGDLDLALAGWYGPQITRIYRNDGGIFVDSQANLLDMDWVSFSWGDYDNDGDLDLAYAGTNGSFNTCLYRNDGGTFVDTAVGVTGVCYSALNWGDYDNDGDLDLAVAGHASSTVLSRVYRNNAGTFVDATAGLPGVEQGSLGWGDYDNDGDLDLALCGSGHAQIYRNSGGRFVANGAGLPGVQWSALAWGDYDNDGDLDLALAGNSGSNLSRVYRNDVGSFVNATGDSLPGVFDCSLSWGDYDNDGDLDLALAGFDGSHLSRVYRNDAGSFANATGDSLPGVRWCFLGWGDYDNDGDLDLALSGNTGSQYLSRIYRSFEAEYGNSNSGSRAPGTPALVSSAGYDADREILTLRWDPATDNGDGATPADGLYYEVRMATEPISDGLAKWVISPSTGLGVGSSSSQNIGNYPHGYCVGSGTQPGVNIRPTVLDCTYYWQVRTIDTGLCRSGWSTALSTYVPSGDKAAPGVPTGLTAEMSTQVTLSWTAPGDNGYLGNVQGGMWRIDYSSTITPTPGETGGAGVNTWYSAADFVPGDRYSTVVTGLHPGVPYYFQIQARDDTGKWSGWSSTASAVAGGLYDSNQGTIAGANHGSLSWGDYDNDGDLDLALTGDSGSGLLSCVYRNDAGSFVNATGDDIDGLSLSALSWGDYDNDGDLDLALAGSGTSRVYRNDAGMFNNATGSDIMGVGYCMLSWGDFDNDGDLDLAVAGYNFDDGRRYSRVYRNTAGSFVNATGASIIGVADGTVNWGDYDNDGDLDLALTGFNGPLYSRVYRNDAGSFVNATAGSLAGVRDGSLGWADYDNDGDLDLALSGFSGGGVSRVYRNDAGNFVNATADTIRGVYRCSLSWGDYDNDGDMDFALSGQDSSGFLTHVYRNDANSFINATGDSISGVSWCSLSWGDYDSDGDLDLALAGLTASAENITRLYQSLEADYGNANTGARLPSAPSAGLSAAFDSLNRRISLRWNRSTDNGAGATPQNGLSYEIRVSTQAWATTPDSVTKWYVSPSTGVGVGSASSQNLGNYPHGYCDPATLQPGVNLTTLAYDATYYWQVRTIDAGLGKSPWSAVQSRYVPAVDMIGPAGISNLTALYGGSCAITLNWTAPGTDGASGDLAVGSIFRITYSTVGILTAALFDAPPANYAATTVNVATTAVAGSAQSLTLTGLTPAATCWFAVKTMDAWGNWSVWNSSADVASVNTLAWRAVISLPPAPVTDLSAAPAAAEGAVALTWTSPRENDDGTGGSVTRYTVRHATFSASSLSGGATAWWAHPGVTAGLVISSASINVPGVTETGIVASLAPGATYYFGIVSEDALAGVSDIDVRAYTAQATAAAPDLPPDPPTGLAVVSVSTYSISLAWDIMSGCTGYMDFSYYALYRSTAGAAMALVSTTTFTVYVDTAVIVETTYYYQLNAVDSGPSVLSGGMGPILAVCMPAAPVFNSAVPRAPSGIKLESTRSVRTIRWSPVRYNSDGTPSTNLARYAVYRSNDPRGGWTLAGTTDTCAWNDTTPITGTWYYTVRAVTTDGVESADSLLCDTAFNILAISDDSRVLLTIPSTVASPLYQGQVCDEDVTVVVAPLDAQPGLTAVAVYELTALNAQTDEEVAAFRFAKTRAKLTYFCQDAAAPQDADDLAFSWFNGVEWIRVGTEQEGASIVTMTSRLGTYAVRETMRATTFTLYSVYPRTFTPNGDNRNDHVEFQYDNPRDAFVVGKIYDKAGALVTELREGIQMDSLMWDGTTSKGTRARPGAYVYQIEVTGSESKVINGIVVVAR